MVSVIIVNYFNESLILNCLESLFKFHSSLEIEVIIINNGGQLNDLLTSFSDKVKIIDSGSNSGFSKANNLGILHSKGEYLLFLNPDTYFISNALSKCVEKLISDQSIGLLGCRLLNPDSSLQLSYHNGDRMFKKLWFRNPLAIKFFKCSEKANESLQKIKTSHLTDHIAPWLTGAFLLTSKEIIKKHDLLWDEDFFMYWEDVELCYRSRTKGLKTYYFTGAELVHIGGSGENVSLTRFSMMEKSKLLFLQKVKGNFIKNLYISFFKFELRFEKFLNRKDLNSHSEKLLHFKNELNYYDI